MNHDQDTNIAEEDILYSCCGVLALSLSSSTSMGGGGQSERLKALLAKE
jgi:hypothetical protein